MFVLLIAFIFTALFFLLFSIITKDIKRSAIVVTFYCFLFFTYGRLYDIVKGFQISGLLIGRPKYLLPLYGLIVIAGTLWIFRSRWRKIYFKEITYFFNIFSLGLFIVAASVAITNFDWITFGSKKHTESKNFSIKKGSTSGFAKQENKILQPNVYYIILDSYASHRVLKKYYDWDDSDVVDALRSRGFSVNKNAYSNYPFTGLSLGATLNMRYIHGDRGFIDANSKLGYLIQHRQQNKVMERFKSEGYDVVSNIGDYRFPNNKRSIFNRKKSLFSDDFAYLVVHVSILRIIEKELIVDVMRQDILSILEDLKLFDIPNKPTFIFVCVTCPHPPYIFNADGSKPNLFESVWGRLKIKKSYIEQVRFIGTQIIEIVDSLRRRDPSAVIVVQADHGNGIILGTYLELLDHKRPPLEFLDAQFGILSAIYSPPGIMMPKQITPVNLFRYMFNTLFDAKLEVLSDRAFFTAIKEPYAFYEVTNDLKRLKAE